MEINLTEMASVKQTCIEFMSEFLNKLDKVIGEVVVLVEVLKGDIRDLKKEDGLLKRVVSNISLAEDEPSKIKVPEPKAYNETWNAKKLENFLWDIEQYFLVA